MFTDLHLHTSHSDGKLSVKETIDIAFKKKVDLISITDHDTISGINEAIQYSYSKGLICISGIELSCRNENASVAFPQDVSIHLLGYNINYHSSELQDYLNRYHAERTRILLKLISELVVNDLNINYKKIDVIAGKQMRVQDIINYISSHPICSKKKQLYINIAKRYYLKLLYEDCPLQMAIKLIKNSGGISVLAHPFFSYRDYDVEFNSRSSVINLLDYLCDLGLDGIEAFYPKNTNEQTNFLQNEAQKRKLFVTAGSDFHGTTLRQQMMDYNIADIEETTKYLLKVNHYKP